MAWEIAGTYGAQGPSGLTLNTTLTQRRLFRWTAGTPITAASPNSSRAASSGTGLAADGVTFENALQYVSGVLTPFDPAGGYLAARGLPVLVESGAAIASGANLQSDSVGRVITAAGGVVVGRALQAAAGAGVAIWVVFA